MTNEKIEETNYAGLLIAAGFAAAAITAAVVLNKRRNRRLIPARSFAHNEVTGGFPEDMNGMPPNTDFNDELPVHDGSRI